MSETYSIAEARDQFAALIREVEGASEPVSVTRRGKPVAVILSVAVYEQLASHQQARDFQIAYREFRERWDNIPMDVTDDVWQDVRDKEPGRETNAWH
ncbi:MAG: type II toxin-antitoxin system Phd/YefM family antitoxin [Anaerolineae bacterium]|nr:type II toxin-antitoxin system Phd/YefM family antitoxin [Anaerolineae bacterium]MCO5193048.1 type II toxin-antitoxin system Phd/YefM family antitoxin [Anaerolineae bacterium]MCO5206172.1 type II toxin-antitoxin system Phd/YefM family antitoxin [Anaerolineae bacterium]